MEGISIKLWRREYAEVEALAVRELEAECFGDVSEHEIEENFISQEFARIFAYHGSEIVGTLALQKRRVSFEGTTVLLGGMSGVCVRQAFRRMGIATEMLKKGLNVLRDENCDVACLNVDLKKHVYGVYEKVGFRLMERDISFENSKGEIVRDNGTMFIPICTPAIYDLIMHNSTTFHYGKGYW